MTREQAFKNGLNVHSAAVLEEAPDWLMSRVNPGEYGFHDGTQPSDYAATSMGVNMGVGVVPGAFTGPADTDGMDVTLRVQSGGADAGANPRGGDFVILCGAAGAGGTGRPGSFSVPGTGINSETLGLGADAAGEDSVAVGAGAQAGGDRCSVFGQGAAPVVTGVDNTILGQGSAGTLTTGFQNVYVGSSVDGVAGTHGSVLIGYSANTGVSGGAASTIVIGSSVGNAGSTGNYCTIVGNSACIAAMTGNSNSVYGNTAGLSLTSGHDNTILGQVAALTLTTGYNNVYIGVLSDGAADTRDSIIIGYGADTGVTGATSTIVIGSSAGNGGSTGDRCTVVGNDACTAAMTGADNCVFGALCAANLTSATNNCFMGTNTATTATQVSNVVCLGDFADVSANNITNAVAVGAASNVSSSSVSVGHSAGAGMTGVSNVVVGQGVAATLVGGTQNVCIGAQSDLGAAVQEAVVIGYGASAVNNTCVVLGHSSVSTAINQFVCGGNNKAITDIYFGEGVTNGTPPNITYHGTGGSGSNIAGGDLSVAGGIGTGIGLGGEVIIQCTDYNTGGGAANPNTLQWVAKAIPDEGTITALNAAECSRGWLERRAVEAQTSSPYSVLSTDSNKVFTNSGAGGGVTFNLPTAEAGLTYTFVVATAQNLIIDAAAGDTIQAAGNVSAASGTATSNTIGDVLVLVAIDSTQWMAISVVGAGWAIV